MYLRQLFPLGTLTAEINAQGQVQEIVSHNSQWEIDYQPPLLKLLRLTSAAPRPLQPESRITLEYDGAERTHWLKDGAATITAFNGFLPRRAG